MSETYATKYFQMLDSWLPSCKCFKWCFSCHRCCKTSILKIHSCTHNFLPRKQLTFLSQSSWILPSHILFYFFFQQLHSVRESMQWLAASPFPCLHRNFEIHVRCIHHLYHSLASSTHIHFAIQQGL